MATTALTKVSKSVAPKPGKRIATRYAISIPTVYKQKLMVGFRGMAAAGFIRQHTDELWDAPYSELTCAQYGAFRRILLMFARSKDSLQNNLIIVTKKELKNHGISEHLLKQIRLRTNVLDISLISDDGEINDLEWL